MGQPTEIALATILATLKSVGTIDDATVKLIAGNLRKVAAKFGQHVSQPLESLAARLDGF